MLRKLSGDRKMQMFNICKQSSPSSAYELLKVPYNVALFAQPRASAHIWDISFSHQRCGIFTLLREPFAIANLFL